MNLLKNWMIIIGAIIMIISLYPMQQIKKKLPEGPLRSKWDLLSILILFFFAGYIVFVVAQWNRNLTASDFIVPFIFFFGAIFALLTSSLAVQTAMDILRINKLEQDNITDPLMEINNRRHFDMRLIEEISRAHRYNSPLALFMVDVDHFKKINDTFGHDIGDDVLVELGRLIQDQVRRNDIVARYGGEEITIIAPETTIEVARTLGERLRSTIEDTVLVKKTNSHPAIKATVSIGISGLTKNIVSMKDFIQKADVALYEAKSNGRNKVVVFEES
ncbi:MAG: GGDEF domain-containing protein [Candidatus Cloacimonetes bacterium]|nr:GGDEF domain-containing protein [Candidatus Cloacimonadota bacterium]